MNEFDLFLTIQVLQPKRGLMKISPQLSVKFYWKLIHKNYQTEASNELTICVGNK
jgi:hypothetical protein